MFRDFGALSPAAKHRLVLTEDFERAGVLAVFLAFVVHGTFAIPGDGTTLASLTLVKHLVLFMRKYACVASLKLLLLSVRDAVRQPSAVSPLVGFLAGAIAEDAYTCSSALDVSDWTWDMMRVPGAGAGGANVFDPHHMPVAVWQMIPGMYTWALTTAWKGDSHHDAHDPHAVRRQDSALSMSSLGSLRYGYASHRDRPRQRQDSRFGDEDRFADDSRADGSVLGSSVSRRPSRVNTAAGREPDVQRKVYAWQQWL